MGWSGGDEELREVYREIAHYIVVSRWWGGKLVYNNIRF